MLRGKADDSGLMLRGKADNSGIMLTEGRLTIAVSR
jgi:hypothetical protein